MRICVPAASPEDWKRLLADPEKHWRIGYSARALAHCWQETNGFPPEVAQIFKTADDSALRSVEPLLILPEYKVSLPGKGYASQNDIFVLGKSSEGSLVSIMVEGKVNEPFSELMGEWRTTRQSSDLAADARSSANKQDRLAGLCERVGLNSIADTIHYQLLHRTASAVIEANTYNAAYAVMLVHSFSSDHAHWEAFDAFVSQYGKTAARGQLVELMTLGTIRLWVGWVQGDARYLSQ